LSNLLGVELDHNMLEGPIPSLDGPGNLNFFLVNDNRLSGPIPQAPPSLRVARVCPNLLDIRPNSDSSVDPAWDAATATTPWWRDCDLLFAQGFE